jgi:hypothetical protein
VLGGCSLRGGEGSIVGEACGFLVASDGQQVTAINGPMQHKPHHDAHKDQQNKWHGNPEEFSAGQRTQQAE